MKNPNENTEPYYVRITPENIEILTEWRFGIDARYSLKSYEHEVICRTLWKGRKYTSKEHDYYNSVINLKPEDNYYSGEEISFEEFCKREGISYTINNTITLQLW